MTKVATGRDRHAWPTAAAAWPGLRHGLRLSAAVCLAFWLCFYLELDAPYWAATSAAISCQPTLGASRRKGVFRLVGTLVGAVFVVLLAAVFPQSRWGFLIGVAVWGALCGFTATLLSNYAAYGASLAGYTVAIIAGDASSSLDQVFVLAVSRASEIMIGIACATVLVAGTDLGQARRQLMLEMSSTAALLSSQLIALLQTAGSAGSDSRPLRRDVIKRITALGPTIDAAFGEVSDLRERRSTLLSGVDGLFAVTAEWRTLADHLDREGPAAAASQTTTLLRSIPVDVQEAMSSNQAHVWCADPVAKRDACTALALTVLALPADEPSLRLTADRFAVALTDLARVANSLALLSGSNLVQAGPHRPWMPGGQDLLPPLVNAVRVFATIASVEFFWVATNWPGGQSAVTFAFIAIILMSPQNEKAAAAAGAFAWAMVLAVALAAVVKFALLPAQQGFAGFVAILALVLVPLGALSTVPRLAPYLVLAVANFGALMGITNVTDYDVLAFYNSALPSLLGVCAAAVALSLIPPVPPKIRAANLLAATLAELRNHLTRPGPIGMAVWEARLYGRLAAMPAGAAPIDRGRLVAALTIGREVLQLRSLATGTSVSGDLQDCFQDVARGLLAEAFSGLSTIDRRLVRAPLPAGAVATMRARAALQSLAEALDSHPVFFGRLGVAR